MHGEPAVLNNHPLPGATSLGKNATHVRNPCHEIRFEWKSKGNVVSFLHLGLIIPFPTRRLLFSLKRRASLPSGPFSNPSWHLNDLKNTLPQHGFKTAQPLSRKTFWYIISPSISTEVTLKFLWCGKVPWKPKQVAEARWNIKLGA